MPHTECAEPKRNPCSKNVGKSKGAKDGDPSSTHTAQKYDRAAMDQSRPGVYPNIVLLQSAIRNKNTVLYIILQLQYLLPNGHCLLHLKVEHTLATRHVLLPYIDAHCTYTLTTCHELFPYIDAQCRNLLFQRSCGSALHLNLQN